MSRQATIEFEKAAKKSGYEVDLSRGVYGELLAKRTRSLWYFWFQGWKTRQALEKKKRARSKPGADRG